MIWVLQIKVFLYWLWPLIFSKWLLCLLSKLSEPNISRKRQINNLVVFLTSHNHSVSWSNWNHSADMHCSRREKWHSAHTGKLIPHQRLHNQRGLRQTMPAWICNSSQKCRDGEPRRSRKQKKRQPWSWSWNLQTRRSEASRKRMWTYRHCPNRFQPSSDGEEKSGMESCDSVQSAETDSTLMSSPSVYTSAGS